MGDQALFQSKGESLSILEFESFALFAAKVSKWTGSSVTLKRGSGFYPRMGNYWPVFRFLGKLADGGQYCNHDCNLSHGVCHENSQNRDGLALQIKLDEIIRAVGTAHNGFIDLEDRSHDELDEIKTKFASVAKSARKDKSRGSRRSLIK